MKSIFLPASKSITNRAFLLSALSKAPVVLQNVLDCDDSRYMQAVLETLGVRFEKKGNDVLVTPPKILEANGESHYIGNAGTAARFLSALSLLVEGSFTLDGVERMRERPQNDLHKALKELGVEVMCKEKEGFLPTTFQGKAGFPLSSSVKMSGKVSSQFVSALLLVAPRLDGGLTIELDEVPPSQPYIDMTLQMLRIWGAKTRISEDKKTITVKQGIKSPEKYEIPADMSSASYPLVWSLLTKTPIKLQNTNKPSLQGDEAFVDLVKKTGNKPFGKVDFSAMPDVAMTGMILAACAEGESTFTGLESLRVKECDRIQAMVEGLLQLGVDIKREGDEVIIKGGGKEKILNQVQNDILIKSYNDQRIAMCFGILRSAIGKHFKIGQPECVAKTWPDFWLELADWENALRPVSASIIERDDTYLIVQKPRKEHAWQFPQGGVEKGEQGIIAAGRELNEECGDDLHVKYVGGREIGSYKYFFPEDFVRWQKEKGTEKRIWKGAKVSFYRALYIDGEVQVDQNEIIDHKWVTKDQFKDYFEGDYLEVVMNQLV